jgi:hypothetical protein
VSSTIPQQPLATLSTPTSVWAHCADDYDWQPFIRAAEAPAMRLSTASGGHVCAVVRAQPNWREAEEASCLSY